MANLTSAAIFIQCFFSLACDLKFQETTTVVIDEQVRQLTTDSRLKEHPAWSPDGSMIAYSYQGTVTTLTARALTGEELEILGRVEDDLRNARFDFSPDGTRLVYYSSNSGQLRVLNLQNGSEVELTTPLSFAREPAWSPDGAWIAFTAQEPGSAKINVWIIPAEDGAAQKITDTDGRDALPSWSPDSKSIAYESTHEISREIWSVEVATSDSRQLTPDSIFAMSPDWSPDGSLIALVRISPQRARGEFL